MLKYFIGIRLIVQAAGKTDATTGAKAKGQTQKEQHAVLQVSGSVLILKAARVMQ